MYGGFPDGGHAALCSTFDALPLVTVEWESAVGFVVHQITLSLLPVTLDIFCKATTATCLPTSINTSHMRELGHNVSRSLSLSHSSKKSIAKQWLAFPPQLVCFSSFFCCAPQKPEISWWGAKQTHGQSRLLNPNLSTNGLKPTDSTPATL